MKSDVTVNAMNRDELVKAYRELEQSHDELARQVEWFKRQLFGSKSERRTFEDVASQLTLGQMRVAQGEGASEVLVAEHRRRRETASEAPDAEALRFDPSVPVKEIVLGEVKDPEEHTLVGKKVTERLAQLPGSYVVLRYVRLVYKRKADGEFCCPPAPPAVIEKSCADVSFLAGLLVDKFVSHLPLYRQHQRLEASGVHLARSTLTHLVHESGELLRPIYTAQVGSILAGDALAMDETPIKAGRKKGSPPHRGKMKTGYFWPIYGDKDEIAFPFAPTRGGEVVRQVLREFVGVLMSDGYRCYERYAEATNRIVHAQCWAHTRRHFEEAESAEPVRSLEALEIIAELYRCEQEMKTKALSPEQIVAYRGEHAKPIVDRFLAWLRDQLEREVFLPTNPFTKAANYTLAREGPLRVFLEYPNVPLDTNHLERAIRPVAIGRKNWLFCWTEVGAEYAGIIQSLLSTCRIQGVNPYAYLVDVLQRIDTHPAKDVALLTPRLWKRTFANNPLRSDIHPAPPACQD